MINKESLLSSLNLLPSQKIHFIGLYTPRTEYCLIVLLSGLGSSLLISSSDLISMYLSIELQSFALYILATIYVDYESSTSAGLKYFLLGALSSCFILLGAGLIYTFTGLTNFESIYSLISVTISSDLVYGSQQIISGVSLGLILIFIGFLFKIAAAPLHSWSPDVYDDTPTQVTIWLTIIPKIAILVLLLELQSGLSINPIIDLPVYDNMINQFNLATNILKMLLLISSLFSLIIGTIVGLSQTRIKSLLAYSTVSHLGFILLALAINTQQSTDSFIFYILQYSITNLNIFLIIIALGYILNIEGIKTFSNSNNVYFFDYDIKLISYFKGQFIYNSILSLSLIICLFSLAGIPPLLGFFSKQFVLLSAVESGYWFMAFVAILTSVISASYYLRMVVILVTGSDYETDNSNHISAIKNYFNNDSILTNLHSLLISTITLSILLFIFKPTLILNSTQLLSLSLFYC
jgi:NADH-ubiquinone oxidoreductase chain 2